MGICYVCKAENETRPYGENGQDICFDCATTSERKAATEAKMAEAFTAAAHQSNIVIIGEETGPRPFIDKTKLH